MNERKSEQQRPGWSTLIGYSLVVFAVGMITGLLPDQNSKHKGPWWAWLLIYVPYAALWLFTLAGFASIGFTLEEKQKQ